MTRRTFRVARFVAVALGAGFLFGPISCVQDSAGIAGSGLGLGGASGLFGETSPTMSAGSAGPRAVADVGSFGPVLLR